MTTTPPATTTGTCYICRRVTTWRIHGGTRKCLTCSLELPC